MQITNAWGTSAADVNLVVLTPAHERVPDQRTRSTANGFHLDRDCPGEDGCGGQNLEDVYFDGLEPPRGHYVVEITLVDLHGAEPPIKVPFAARLRSLPVVFTSTVPPATHA